MCQKGWQIEKTCKKSTTVNKNRIKRTRSTEEKHGILLTSVTHIFSEFRGIHRILCQFRIDGHVSWNSKRRLLLVICWPRKTNFRFLFSENKLMFAVCSKQMKVSVFRIYIWKYIYIHILIYIHVYSYIYLFLYTCCHFKRKSEG